MNCGAKHYPKDIDYLGDEQWRCPSCSVVVEQSYEQLRERADEIRERLKKKLTKREQTKLEELIGIEFAIEAICNQ